MTQEIRVCVNYGQGWVRATDLEELVAGRVASIQIYGEPGSVDPRPRPIQIAFEVGEHRRVDVEYRACGYTDPSSYRPPLGLAMPARPTASSHGGRATSGSVSASY